MIKTTGSVQDRKLKTRRLTLFAMLLCVELLLIFTPLGFVPVGPVNATTLHIPVILAAILMGPLEGSALGLVFGLSSLIKNTIAPTITSFVFSPFYSLGEFRGNGWSVWIALGPRILLGLFAALLFRFLRDTLKKPTLAAGLAAGVSTLLHTAMVMGSIYLFFGKDYAAARQIGQSALLTIIGTVILTNGVAELIIAAIVAMGVYRFSAKRGTAKAAKLPKTADAALNGKDKPSS